MSERTVTTWTCNRCHATVDLDHRYSTGRPQPRSWGRLVLIVPPRASTESDSTKDYGHLCPDCCQDLISFKNGAVVDQGTDVGPLRREQEASGD